MKKTVIAFTTAALVSTFAANSTEAASYKVQSGDSLSVIAYNYDTTVTNLKSWNDLTSNTIYVNQVLEVSAPSTASATTYKVQSGDYLSKIGMKYDVYVAELKEWNNLTSDVIYPGQTLIVSYQEVLPQYSLKLLLQEPALTPFNREILYPISPFAMMYRYHKSSHGTD